MYEKLYPLLLKSYGDPALLWIDSWSGFIDYGISEVYKLRNYRKLVGCRGKFKGIIDISLMSHTYL